MEKAHDVQQQQQNSWNKGLKKNSQPHIVNLESIHK